MSMGRLEIEGEPGAYISGSRARWLLQARRACLGPSGRLRLLPGPAAAPGGANRDEGGPRVLWSAYSSAGVRNRSGIGWLGGYRMNGGVINRGYDNASN